MNTEEQIQSFRESYATLRAEIGKVIVGHDAIVEGTLIAVLAGGHVLLEGVPGLGKTLLVRTLSEVLDLSFESIELLDHFRVVLGFFRRANQPQAQQNRRQRIAEFMRRNGEEIVASFDSLAQLFDESFGTGPVSGLPGVIFHLRMLGVRAPDLRP